MSPDIMYLSDMITDDMLWETFQHYSKADSSLHLANERWCYFVTTSLIGWVQT